MKSLQSHRGLLAHFTAQLSVAILFLAVGCNDQQPVQPKPRVVLTTEIKTVAADNNVFAFDLYGQLRDENAGKNLICSPFSISKALAMTYAGARGDTETQMSEVLHFNLQQTMLHEAMGDIGRDLVSAGEHGPYRLDVANRLWGRLDTEFLETFLSVTRDNYDAELKRLDFAGEPERARATINQWVEENTNDRIRELLKPGMIKSSTVLVLTNAIYFKGKWQSQFEPKNTRDLPFHVSQDRSVDVPMMFQSEDFRFARDGEVSLLELPYRANELSMLVILPHDVDGLAAVESQLNQTQLTDWLGKLRKQEVRVWLPRFKFTSDFGLNDTLTTMGMPLAFSGAADFSGMTGHKGLFIDAVVHQAFVEVNEEGTEAAAATGVVMAESAAAIPVEFRADHPFIFLIRDHHSGSILFMGRVIDPLH